MKSRLFPTEISLKEIPPEGREYTYTRESGELTAALKDLIGPNGFRVAFKITPMGNAFDLRGEVKTSLGLQCALCAMDFNYLVDQKLHELLVVQEPMAKGDQQTRANHAHEWEEGGPDYIILDSQSFKVGDYIHEVIGLAEPIRPLGKPDCDDGQLNCENLTDSMKKWIQNGPLTQDPIRANPFGILEKMKLKS